MFPTRSTAESDPRVLDRAMDAIILSAAVAQGIAKVTRYSGKKA
jgi:hypothetical protein